VVTIVKNEFQLLFPYWEIMYLKKLTVKGRPPPRYSFQCTLLYNLPTDDQNLPKHVADGTRVQSVQTDAFALAINRDCSYQTQRDDDSKQKYGTVSSNSTRKPNLLQKFTDSSRQIIYV
jgi:hypothetical protein